MKSKKRMKVDATAASTPEKKGSRTKGASSGSATRSFTA